MLGGFDPIVSKLKGELVYMKKLFAGIAVVLFCLMAACTPADAGPEFGLGYQKMFAADDEYDGVSLRVWFDKLALEGNAFFAKDEPASGADTETQLFTGKVLFAPVTAENAKFYVGAEVGTGTIETTGFQDEDVTIYGPLFGSEFNFPGLQQVKFNFEVGYQLAETDTADVKDDMEGIKVGTGIKYYF